MNITHHTDKNDCKSLVVTEKKMTGDNLNWRSTSMEIRKVGILGLGALGTMYAKHMLDHGFSDGLAVIVDQERKVRYEREGVYCNGEKCEFPYIIPDKTLEPLDLLIIAVKFGSLETALEEAVHAVGENTVIISLLNGISSEKIIGSRFGMEKMVYCVAFGMDAVKLGNKMNYTNKGVLCFGDYDEENSNGERVDAITSFFDKIQLPYQIDNFMKRKLWSKFMVNVGVNQTAMVYQTNYGGIQKDGPARTTMIKAMREVLDLSEAEGIGLNKDDLTYWLNVLDGLDPQGMPSMRQDSIRGQKSEVELFSSECIRLGEKHSIPTPVNKYLNEKITEMEKMY